MLSFNRAIPLRHSLSIQASDSKALLLLNRVRDVLLKEQVHPRAQPLTSRKKLNIMCFDGGGLRGVMGTILMERIQAEFPVSCFGLCLTFVLLADGRSCVGFPIKD